MRGLGEVLFCHATPRSDVEIFTRLTAEERLFDAFDGVTTPIVVCGHTHMQFDRMIRGIRVVNAGSVGMPFGEPGAYWLLLGPEVSPQPHALRPGGRGQSHPRARPIRRPRRSPPATSSARRPRPAMLQVFSQAEPG